MIKIDLKKYPHLIIDKQILQVLRWFKNNKICSYSDNFNNVFDTSFNRDHYYRTNIYTSFSKNKLMEQYIRQVYDSELTNQNPKFLLNLEHYLNAIIFKSFYSASEIRGSYEMSDFIITNHFEKYGRSKVINVIEGNSYYKFNLSLFESYYQSRFKLKNFVNDLFSRQILHPVYNHTTTAVLKLKYTQVIKDLNSLLIDLNFKIETCAIAQDCITGLFFHKNYTLSFYKGVNLRELKEIFIPHYKLFLLNEKIEFNDSQYKSDSDLNIWSDFVNNAKNIKPTTDNNKCRLYELSPSGSENTLELFYIDDLKTVIAKDDKAYKNFNFINFKSNNNILRDRDYDITQAYPFGRLPFEPINSTYFGIELECYIKESYLDDTRGKRPFQIIEEKILKGSGVCKSDGSLKENGVEINTIPMTLNYIQKTDYFLNFYKQVKNMLESYEQEETGIHIHISKNNLSKVDVMRIQQFINDEVNLNYIKKMAGRNPNSYCEVNNQLKLKTYKSGVFNSKEKFLAVNILHKNSIELRIFKGTLNPITIHRQIEFCHALTNFVKNTSYLKLSSIDFIKYASENKNSYPLLFEFNNEFVKWGSSFSVAKLKGIETYTNKTLRKKKKRNIQIKFPELKTLIDINYKPPRITKVKLSDQDHPSREN
jgi:hypothetical protein